MTGLTQQEQAAIQAAARAAVEYRQSVPNRPVPPQIDLDAAVDRFRTPLADAGQAADDVLDHIARDGDAGLMQMCAPTFYGYVLGASHPMGVAADMLLSAWGQNAGSSAGSPSITGMERAVCDWLLDLLGLPGDSGVGLVTGATVANTQGVMAARNALLAKQGWDVEDKGLFGAPEIPVLIGEHAHSAPFAALRYAGFGAGRAIQVTTDNEGRIDPDAFAAALDLCKAPPLVILQAGQINSGAFDPFEVIIPMVHAKGGWVHVDGAFALWLAAVPDLAGRCAGVQMADSWAVDLHKWLNAPFGAGACIVRDRAPLVASMSARGAYLPDFTNHWEPADSTIELSRRAIGVPSYAIMRHLGASGIREMITRHCNLATYLAESLAEIDGFEVLNQVASNQVAIRCTDGDARTQKVLELVQERGKVYPSHGEWRGHQIIRASIIGYATEQTHIDLLIAELQSALQTAKESDAA